METDKTFVFQQNTDMLAMIPELFRLKIIKKPHIGFVTSNPASYFKADAGTRFRFYDATNYLKTQQIYGERYKKNRNYKVVVFIKCFQDHHVSLAKDLKSKGNKIIFDIDVNYVDLVGEALNYVKPWQRKNILSMLELSDEVITISEKNGEIYRDYHQNVTVIEESIEDRFFEMTKTHADNEPVYLLYCGQSVKAPQILLIEDVLKELFKQYPLKMLYICEKDPKMDVFPYKFVKYDHAKLPELLIKGDIKIAPRDLSDSYNWGHSFSKVAYPMSVGIPAAASPVPSYLNREVVICHTPTEWYDNLKELILSPELRKKKGLAGKKVVRENFSLDAIGPQFVKLFQKYL